MLNIAIICGGVSQERGISLNSARSFLDHTSSLALQLTLLYVNPEGLYFKLSPGQLYSNTPADFDFKLAQESLFLEEEALLSLLKTMDLVFPLMHGACGEDGTLQHFFEIHNIPYVGSSSQVCKKVFNKHLARELLKKEGFKTLPSLLIISEETPIEPFWKAQKLHHAIIKPTESGSSIGVCYVDSISSAQKSIATLLKKGFHELLLEPYCQGVEFTICVLENHEGEPVALIPLEIDIGRQVGSVLDFRKKYLPTEQTRYYCPPRFSEETLQKIRQHSEHLFKKFGLRDFVRMDGWVLNTGEVLFSDFNPISGMEQNSFLFQQASKIEMSHTDLIEYVLKSALKRTSLQHTASLLHETRKSQQDLKNNQRVYVLMGGVTAERQVSLMSGTNVWLKLRYEKAYDPIPFLLDHNDVWQLPYAYTLHHTVEEIKEHCHLPQKTYHNTLKEKIRLKLGLPPVTFSSSPILMDLNTFIEKAKQEKAFVFLALHGGIGEDGTLQRLLENHHIPFNGSHSTASKLCMDKKETTALVKALNNSSILSMPQLSFPLSSLKGTREIETLWEKAVSHFKTEDLLIKPQCDGCSAGVVRLQSLLELVNYIECCHQGHKTFKHHDTLVEMPFFSENFLLEPFIHTDKISISGSHLNLVTISGWCEMTIGVVEKQGIYHAFPPSITIAESYVLSLEEKFQGGTGINITPPPKEILSETLCKQVEDRACLVAKQLDIKNYARLDLFVQRATGIIRVIEVNTLPALTPSTVLFHQALCASPPLTPKELLSLIIENASCYNPGG